MARKCGIIYIYGVPPKWKKKRKLLAKHNGCLGSQIDDNLRKKYRRKGYKFIVSKQR